MLYEVCKYCRNFFPVENITRKWNIENGRVLQELHIQPGQYFAIEGSVFNDGVHQYDNTDLLDEEFIGTITPMAIPDAFLQVVEEIVAYQAEYHPNDFQAESFAGYSYTKGSSTGWQEAFKNRLKIWRKI